MDWLNSSWLHSLHSSAYATSILFGGNIAKNPAVKQAQFVHLLAVSKFFTGGRTPVATEVAPSSIIVAITRLLWETARVCVEAMPWSTDPGNCKPNTLYTVFAIHAHSVCLVFCVWRWFQFCLPSRFWNFVSSKSRPSDVWRKLISMTSCCRSLPSPSMTAI